MGVEKDEQTIQEAAAGEEQSLSDSTGTSTGSSSSTSTGSSSSTSTGSSSSTSTGSSSSTSTGSSSSTSTGSSRRRNNVRINVSGWVEDRRYSQRRRTTGRTRS